MGSASMPRQQLQLALNTNLWGFSRAQRCSLIEELSGHGFSFPNWKEKSDSVVPPVKKGSGKGKRKRKGEDEGGKGGKGDRKGRKGKKRGRRGDKEIDPDDPFNDYADGKTGANTIEVKWKPPGAKDSDEEDDDDDEDDEYDEDGEDGEWWNEEAP